MSSAAVDSPGAPKVRPAEPVILQTLLRGLAVLDVVAASGGRITAKQIAHEVGVRPATCYHLLRTLVSEGYLLRGAKGTYDVGPLGGRLGHRLERQFGPSPEFSALLGRLHTRTSETAYVAGWNHGTIVIQQFISGSGPVSVGKLDVGYAAQMHARASCLSVMAFLPPEIVRTMLFDTAFERLTAQTISSYPQLVKRLAEVRRLGYAVDREEFVDGVCCVSAPYFDVDDQPAGSFTVSAATSRFSSQFGPLASAVLEAATMATRLNATGRLGAGGSRVAGPGAPERTLRHAAR